MPNKLLYHTQTKNLWYTTGLGNIMLKGDIIQLCNIMLLTQGDFYVQAKTLYNDNCTIQAKSIEYQYEQIFTRHTFLNTPKLTIPTMQITQEIPVSMNSQEIQSPIPRSEEIIELQKEQEETWKSLNLAIHNGIPNPYNKK